VSWSYSYKGDAKAAADDINTKFAAMSVTTEPEKTIKSSVQSILLNALTGWRPEFGIEISAWGSQSTNDAGQTNDLNVRLSAFKMPE
jgi:hypothetical protein